MALGRLVGMVVAGWATTTVRTLFISATAFVVCRVAGAGQCGVGWTTRNSRRIWPEFPACANRTRWSCPDRSGGRSDRSSRRARRRSSRNRRSAPLPSECRAARRRPPGPAGHLRPGPAWRRRDAGPAPIRFAEDSPLEEDGFELSVPQKTSSVPGRLRFPFAAHYFSLPEIRQRQLQGSWGPWSCHAGPRVRSRLPPSCVFAGDEAPLVELDRAGCSTMGRELSPVCLDVLLTFRVHDQRWAWHIPR